MASLVSFANSDGILGCLFSHRSHDLQVLCWHPVYLLSSPVHIHISVSDNFLAGMVCILLDCNLLLDGSLANLFWFCGGVPMSAVLDKSQFFRFFPSLQQYSIVFVDQLCDHCGFVFDWHTFKCWKKLDSHGPIPDDFVSVCNCLLQVGVDSLSVYTDEFLSNLDTVGCRAGTATFFEDIGLGLGIDMSSLMSSTLAKLQIIALALKNVSLLSSVKLFSDS
ncbi:hypothetical protein G9A89_012508 [Geosiphon pyriformis]|nr:hypothetical protein G9A89_012508 [Geosiphon pyriformis]